MISDVLLRVYQSQPSVWEKEVLAKGNLCEELVVLKLGRKLIAVSTIVGGEIGSLLVDFRRLLFFPFQAFLPLRCCFGVQRRDRDHDEIIISSLRTVRCSSAGAEIRLRPQGLLDPQHHAISLDRRTAHMANRHQRRWSNKCLRGRHLTTLVLLFPLPPNTDNRSGRLSMFRQHLHKRHLRMHSMGQQRDCSLRRSLRHRPHSRTSILHLPRLGKAERLLDPRPRQLV